MSKITIKTHKIIVVPDDPTGHVRISPAAEQVIRRLQRQTGLSARCIASQIIEQAEDMIEVEEVEG